MAGQKIKPSVARTTEELQDAFLDSLNGQHDVGRLVVKGGSAMRRVLGHRRWTGDVDMDADATMSKHALKGHIEKAAHQAITRVGIQDGKVQQVKDGVTSRWKVRGVADGQDILMIVETSARGMPDAAFTQALDRSIDGRSDHLRVYGTSALAGGKINALLTRSVPRDIYDLACLLDRGATPVPIWRTLPVQMLIQGRSEVEAKVSAIAWVDARTNLLPALPEDIANGLTAEGWDDLRLKVMDGVLRWFDEALHNRNENDMPELKQGEVDYAGRRK